MIKIIEKNHQDLEDYSKIPMRFKRETIYHVNVINQGLGGFLLEEVTGDNKMHDPSFGEGPGKWKKMFDIKNWRIFIAYDKDLPVGGIALAYQTKGCNRLEGKDDLIVVWDLRVHPDYKAQGIGKRLMNQADAFAKEVKASQIKVETQNNNTNACKFYASQGYTLGEVNRFAYRDAPEESMFIFVKNIMV
ncbi:GNAT family N-acetyltransferase [Liberiplasma polymorphum]|uniref:GNAT family N-acetyltransferase n=1 Tax=Liberiplasma polymorphum TaxID=3374570 RepID=UPI003775C7FB